MNLYIRKSVNLTKTKSVRNSLSTRFKSSPSHSPSTFAAATTSAEDADAVVVVDDLAVSVVFGRLAGLSSGNAADDDIETYKFDLGANKQNLKPNRASGSIPIDVKL